MAIVTVISTPEIVTFQVDGTLLRADALQAISAHYGQLNGRATLWDFTRAELQQLSADDLQAIGAAVRERVTRGAMKRLAMVVADGRSYAKVCTYLVNADRVRVPVESRVFMTMPEATVWLAGTS